MSNPDPQLSVTDMNRFMNMTQADLQAELNAQAAITAQLKRNEATLLQDRLDLRDRLTTPPAPDDADVRNDIQRVTGNIADNEREIAYSEAVEKLLRRLLPTPTTSSTLQVHPLDQQHQQQQPQHQQQQQQHIDKYWGRSRNTS